MTWIFNPSTGKYLSDIRLAAGYESVPAAVKHCNRVAKAAGSSILFTAKKLRRFESIGIKTAYGSTPPTYEETQLMVKAYRGSLAYLFFGIEPILYSQPEPEIVMEIVEIEPKPFEPHIQKHLDWLLSLPKERQLKLTGLIETLLDG